MRHLFPWMLLALSSAALAQPPPAPETPSEQPALTVAPSAPAAGNHEEGTTIVGGQDDSPIGQFITPWRDSRAEEDIDRPARLLQEELLPIDQDVFERQVQYYGALSGKLKSRNIVTPDVTVPAEAPK